MSIFDDFGARGRIVDEGAGVRGCLEFLVVVVVPNLQFRDGAYGSARHHSHLILNLTVNS
jgi:hypothetical protein